MGDKAISLVGNAIEAITPGTRWAKKLLLPAKVFWFLSLVGRRIRLFRNPKNLVPLMAGSILDAAIGKLPTMQKASRIVFGSASIVKCSDDILRLSSLARSISRVFKGRELPVIKQKTWNNGPTSKNRSPSAAYMAKINKVKIPFLAKRLFAYLLEVIKTFGLLMLHFVDAITAYREKNATSEIFVHGIDLYNKLTSSDSEIVKHLKKLENVTNIMLKGIGASWGTTALLGLFILPAKVRKAVPGITDLFDNFKRNFALIKEKLEALGEGVMVEYLWLLNRTELLNKVPRQLVPEIERQFDFIMPGQDPNALRFIKEPIIRVP